MPGTWTAIFTDNGATGASTPASGVNASLGNAAITLTDPFIAGQPKVFYRLKVTQQ